MKKDIDFKIKEIQNLLASNNDNYILSNINNFSQEEILLLFDTMTKSQCYYILDNVSKYSKIVFLLFNFGSIKVIKYLFHYFSNEDLFDIFNTMSSNEVAMIYLSNTQMLKERISQSFPKIKYIIANRLKNLDQSFSSLIDCPIIFPYYWTVNEVNKFLKDNFDQSSFYTDIFVADIFQKVIGRIPIRKMFFYNSSEKLCDVYEYDFYFLNENEQITQKIIDLFVSNRIYTIPIINENKKIIGVLNLDDMLQFIENERKEDVEYLGGISSYDDDFVKSVFQRCYCLSFQLLISSFFMFILVKHIPLTGEIASLYPGITGLSGSFVIQSMAKSLQNAQNSLLKELISAVLIGFLIALVMSFGLYITYGPSSIAKFVLPLSLICNFIFGSFIGIHVSKLSQVLGIDAAFLSVPVISAVIDTTGFLITAFLSHIFSQ